MTDFEKEVQERISVIEKDKALQDAAHNFMQSSTMPKYSYNFFSLGRPII